MPHGLEIDAKDNIWITDVGLHQVIKYDSSGQELIVLGQENEPGNDSTHFNLPTDIAVSKNGSFYVSDGYGNSRIIKFSSD
jgi:peptidylamidoglycolate lyase